MEKAWKIELREAPSNGLKEWFMGRFIPNCELLVLGWGLLLEPAA